MMKCTCYKINLSNTNSYRIIEEDKSTSSEENNEILLQCTHCSNYIDAPRSLVEFSVKFKKITDEIRETLKELIIGK